MGKDQIKGRRWQNLTRRVLNEESVCWLCGLPLDFAADPRTRWSPSVDHIIPRSKGGSVYDRANLRAAHYRCNSARGAGDGASIPRRSRKW